MTENSTIKPLFTISVPLLKIRAPPPLPTPMVTMTQIVFETHQTLYQQIIVTDK